VDHFELLYGINRDTDVENHTIMYIVSLYVVYVVAEAFV
jgi:hypothetical protein